jgi:hypothetical protein
MIDSFAEMKTPSQAGVEKDLLWKRERGQNHPG